MALVVNTFKIEKAIDEEMTSYIEGHHMSKSDFIRRAILSYLEDLHDLGAFERTKNDKTYTLAEVEQELGLAD